MVVANVENIIFIPNILDSNTSPPCIRQVTPQDIPETAFTVDKLSEGISTRSGDQVPANRVALLSHRVTSESM